MAAVVSIGAAIVVLLQLWPQASSPNAAQPRATSLSERWRHMRFPGQHRRQIADEFPATLDLICLAIGAGATVGAALRIAAVRGPANTAKLVHPLIVELDTGLSLDSVLRRVPTVVDPIYQPVVVTLRTALSHGSPVGELVLRLGDEARLSRRRRLEKRARQLPVLLLFPLVACSLPALIIGAVVPLVIVSI